MAINDIVKAKKGFALTDLLVVVGTIVVSGSVGFALQRVYSAVKKYTNNPVVERANVINGPEAELFIEKDGKRFYVEIDGKPVSEYLKK